MAYDPAVGCHLNHVSREREREIEEEKEKEKEREREEAWKSFQLAEGVWARTSVDCLRKRFYAENFEVTVSAEREMHLKAKEMYVLEWQ